MTDGETPWPDTPPPGLEGATVIALVTRAEAIPHVPGWIR